VSAIGKIGSSILGLGSHGGVMFKDEEEREGFCVRESRRLSCKKSGGVTQRGDKRRKKFTVMLQRITLTVDKTRHK